MAKKGEQLTEDHQGPRHILAERAMSTPEEGMQATPLMVMFGLACAAQAVRVVGNYTVGYRTGRRR
ncbi:hypothetical protein PF010_g23978 [Phytophthora fragariae]|uniref:Uncharacterized protein n=1 Tax=Phytophthora fragariae TaxID=53985 RepID=A0A6A3WB02_9STRA|nr:hypothetical protein PF010_g23978 [Phytophthora fragariae]KAE9179103.1 hypothetical protein PF002_g27905 [Phytophthora fragariae]KAE9336422.1 hypothetical protein PF008_g13034 [Phytophthora fragariae]